MSITVNGQSCVPPGFRFHPTEEELLKYYLRKKVSCEKIDLDVIRDIDLNKLEPWDIQEECKIGTTPQNDWYFFSHKDKKYPTGTRTNRATAAGFWKATGRDKVIYAGVGRIGMRKTLVFYKGRAPHGQKSEWIMHEYRLDEQLIDAASGLVGEVVAANQEDGWVVCRVFKKKSVGSGGVQQKSFDVASSEGALRQILHYRGRSCKEESSTTTSEAMKLPPLQSPTPATTVPWLIPDEDCASHQMVHEAEPPAGIDNYSAGAGGWSALDRFIASELDHVSQIPYFDQDTTALTGLLCSPPPSFFAMDYHQLQIGDVSLQN